MPPEKKGVRITTCVRTNARKIKFGSEAAPPEEKINARREARRGLKILTGIFKTLEDSGPVLNKLTFHRESSKETGSRLPRILPGQTETYETLHKLLEEMELLLKVWKNRVNHPFTAHLERKPEENNKEPDSGANVR